MKPKRFIGFGIAGVLALVVVSVLVYSWLDRRWHNPNPTKKPWGEREIVGTWQYPSDPEGAATITFYPDGTFQQTVIPKGSASPSKQTGYWAVKETPFIKSKGWGFVEGEVNVYGALCKESTWIINDSDSWSVVDSHKRPGEITIFGGFVPDPDSYGEFTKIREMP